MELREIVAKRIGETVIARDFVLLAVADNVLAIPEIARALQIAADYDKARLGHTVEGEG